MLGAPLAVVKVPSSGKVFSPLLLNPGEDFIQLGNGRGWVDDLYISLPPGAGGALHGIPLGSIPG